MEKDLFTLLVKLPSKVSSLGVILLAVSIDPFQTNSSFLFHLPVLRESDIRSVLLRDIRPSEVSEAVVSGVIRYFAAQTHSLSELRTLRDLALASCREGGTAASRTPDRDE